MTKEISSNAPKELIMEGDKRDVVFYIDLSLNQIQGIAPLEDSEFWENEKMLRIPCKDEWFSYHELLELYSEERGIDVVGRKHLQSYLEDLGMREDFYCFRRELIEQEFNQWCLRNEVHIVYKE